MKYTPAGHVIEASGNVPLWVNLRDVILTALVWLLYFYYMENVFHLFGDITRWTAGGFANTAGYASFSVFHTVVTYVDALLVFEVLFVGWSLYNALRFRNKKRRRAPQPVMIEHLADLYNFNAEDVGAWQDARALIMHHDPEGHLEDVEVKSQLKPAATKKVGS